MRTTLLALGIAALWLATAAPVQADDPDGPGRYRPLFHFTPRRNFMNDPNRLVYFGGDYHMFYQHNPRGEHWGHMSWGHAVSRDLVRWEHMPVAIHEKGGVMIFSGSAIVDHKNTTGFGRGGEPPMV